MRPVKPTVRSAGLTQFIAATMVSRHVFELCTSPTTLISELAKNPDQPVSRVAKQLSKNHGALFKQPADASPVEDEEDTLDIVTRCGSFPHRPSDLFLQVLYCCIIFKIFCNSLIDLLRCFAHIRRRSTRWPRFSFSSWQLWCHPSLHCLSHSRHNEALC